jgi:hypothetical protein
MIESLLRNGRGRSNAFPVYQPLIYAVRTTRAAPSAKRSHFAPTRKRVPLLVMPMKLLSCETVFVQEGIPLNLQFTLCGLR